MWLTFTPIGATPQAAEAATLATKGQNKGPQHIEGGQTSREQGNDIQGIIPMIKGQPNNGFFAIEARKEGETSNGKRGNQPGNTGNGHLWPQTTHQAYILYLAMHGMMQGMQDAASTEEEQSLEESVGEEVEHARARTIARVSNPLSICVTRVVSSPKSNVPVLMKRIMMPIIKPTSPTRFAINASTAAEAGESRSSAGLAFLLIQKPISR